MPKTPVQIDNVRRAIEEACAESRQVYLLPEDCVWREPPGGNRVPIHPDIAIDVIHPEAVDLLITTEGRIERVEVPFEYVRGPAPKKGDKIGLEIDGRIVLTNIGAEFHPNFFERRSPR